ncbi:hypothetical protein [Methanobrevibacter sp.]
MGAWKELDTEISVDTDTSDLEKILTINDEFGIFEPIKETVTNLIKNIHDGSKEAVEDIARRDKSFQEQIIAEKCKNPSGMLQSSIHAQKINDGYGFIVGTVIKHIYPMALEYGRKEVYPIRAKALAFYADSGELLFRKKVGRSRPRPFVAPAYKKTSNIAEEILLRKVEIAKKRI